VLLNSMGREIQARVARNRKGRRRDRVARRASTATETAFRETIRPAGSPSRVTPERAAFSVASLIQWDALRFSS